MDNVERHYRHLVAESMCSQCHAAGSFMKEEIERLRRDNEALKQAVEDDTPPWTDEQFARAEAERLRATINGMVEKGMDNLTMVAAFQVNEELRADNERLRAAIRDAHGLIDNDLVVPWIIAHKLDDVLGIHKL